RAYIRHRMEVAGQKERIFSETALREAHRVSRGVPRLINAICDRAMLGAYAKDERRVDAATVRVAAQEVLGRPVSARSLRPRQWALAGVGAMAVVGGVWVLFTYGQIAPLSRG